MSVIDLGSMIPPANRPPAGPGKAASGGGGSANAVGKVVASPSAAALLDSTPAAPDGAATPRASGDVLSGFVDAGATSVLADAGLAPRPSVPSRPYPDDGSNSGQASSGFPPAGKGPGTGLVSKPGVVSQHKARPRSQNYGPFSGPRK
jgi:hypothetical protein